MIRLSISPDAPDSTLIARAAGVINAGGVVAFPTDTLYGLAVNPSDEAAVDRVFLVKGRPADMALLLVGADVAQVEGFCGPLPRTAQTLAARFWPGPLTLLVPAPSSLPKTVTAGSGLVGIRVPAHLVSRRLCEFCRSLLTATSANVSGQPATDDPDVVAASLGSQLDVLLDAGRTSGGPASTIVDTTVDDLRLVRAGAISWEDVRACVR